MLQNRQLSLQTGMAVALTLFILVKKARFLPYHILLDSRCFHPWIYTILYHFPTMSLNIYW